MCVTPRSRGGGEGVDRINRIGPYRSDCLPLAERLMAISNLLVLSGGELSDDVAERVRARLLTLGLNVRPVSMSKSKAFKSALVEDATSTTTLGERSSSLSRIHERGPPFSEKVTHQQQPCSDIRSPDRRERRTDGGGRGVCEVFQKENTP